MNKAVRFQKWTERVLCFDFILSKLQPKCKSVIKQRFIGQISWICACGFGVNTQYWGMCCTLKNTRWITDTRPMFTLHTDAHYKGLASVYSSVMEQNKVWWIIHHRVESVMNLEQCSGLNPTPHWTSGTKPPQCTETAHPPSPLLSNLSVRAIKIHKHTFWICCMKNTTCV